MTLRVISYGGGVQSTALLVLAAHGLIDFDTALFCNVGDDSEHPDTLAYIRDVARPYAERHGITLHEIRRVRRDGATETIHERITRPGSLAHIIPVRLGRSGKPGSRVCTVDFKLKVTARWLKEHGASPATPATVALGISLDEMHRANLSKAQPHEHLTYPLIGLGEETGLKMTRQDCVALIEREHLPVPPKSACWFCPWQSRQRWTDLARERPDLFDNACALEEHMSKRETDRGRPPVFMTDYLEPLRDVVGTPQSLLPGIGEPGECDSGWCWT